LEVGRKEQMKAFMVLGKIFMVPQIILMVLGIIFMATCTGKDIHGKQSVCTKQIFVCTKQICVCTNKLIGNVKTIWQSVGCMYEQNLTGAK